MTNAAAAVPARRALSWKTVPVLALIAGLACTEEVPTASKAEQEATTAIERSKNVAFVTCVANRERLTVHCGDEAEREGDPSSPSIILGKQGIYVDIVTNNVNYDGGTGDFTFNAQVRNRIPQALGTADGTTLEATGVRVFFNSGPTATGGSGLVTVPTPDGTATFTGPNQPYYQYNEVLSQFELSPTKQWKLNMPNTVTTFAFTLLVNGAVKFPDGYIDLQPDPHTIAPGAQRQMTAFVRNANGEAIPGAVVTWASADPNVFVIDASTGLVTGVKSGVANVMATSGTKVGSAAFTVTGVRRFWTGAVSTDWNTAGNWGVVGLSPAAVTPSAVDTAVVPGDLTNYPLFTSNNSIGGVEMVNGTTVQPFINIGSFDFTLSSSIDHDTNGTITGSVGRMIFTGSAKTIDGGITNIDYRQARFLGTYTLGNNMNITGGRLFVQGGRLRTSGFRIRVRP